MSFNPLRRWLASLHRRNAEDRVITALHLQHYLVRRSYNLKREWGKLDESRKQFLFNNLDLIKALRTRKDNPQEIEVCLYAAFHTCLGYRDVPRYGKGEPLLGYFRVAGELNADYPQQALLCCEVLAAVAMKCRIPSPADRFEGESLLPADLLEHYQKSCRASEMQQGWHPGVIADDPWHYRMATYEPALTAEIAAPYRSEHVTSERAQTG